MNKDLSWILYEYLISSINFDTSMNFLTEPILQILYTEFYFFSKIVICTSMSFFGFAQMVEKFCAAPFVD